MIRNCSLLCGEAHIRKTRENAFEGNRGLRASELEAEAEVRPCAEGKVRIRMARDVETMGVRELCWVGVRRRQEPREHVTAPELASLPDYVAGREARFGHLDRRYVAETFFDAGRHLARIALQPTPLVLVRKQCEKPA